MKIKGSYDYDNLYKVFTSHIKSYLDLIMIDLNGSGVQPKGPFVAFDIISPHIATNYLGDDGANSFDCVVSFTIYDRSKVSAISMAGAWRNALETFRMKLDLKDQTIVINEIMDSQIRSVPETTKSSFMVGFDVRLTLQDTFEDNDIDDITDINL